MLSALPILQAETPTQANLLIHKDEVFPLSHQKSLRSRKHLSGLNISIYSACEGRNRHQLLQHQVLQVTCTQMGSPSAGAEGKKCAERSLLPCCNSHCFTCPLFQQGQRTLGEFGFPSTPHPFIPGAPKSSLGCSSVNAFEDVQRDK